MKMTKIKNKLNKEDFIKVFGVIGTFLIGIILFWWGCNIMIYKWGLIVRNMGMIGHMALTPMFVGLGLSLLSFSEFLKFFRSNEE